MKSEIPSNFDHFLTLFNYTKLKTLVLKWKKKLIYININICLLFFPLLPMSSLYIGVSTSLLLEENTHKISLLVEIIELNFRVFPHTGKINLFIYSIYSVTSF